MAQPIQTPQVGSALQELFRLQGRVRPALEEFIIPTVQVGDLTFGSAPAKRRHVTTFFNVPAVVGERPVWRWEIPGGIIGALTSFWVEPPAATPGSVSVFFGSSIAAPATQAVASYSDGRILRAGELPAGVVSFGTQVGALAARTWEKRAQPTPDSRTWETPGWILGTGVPGQFGFIEFACNLLNASVNVCMEWDEFQLV